MKENLKSLALLVLWVISWGALIVAAGVGLRIASILFKMGWNFL